MNPFRLSVCCVLAVLLAGCGATGGTRGDHAPDKVAAINMELGIAYLREGKLDLALKKLLRAVELDAGWSAAHNSLAILYERLGENDKAARHYRRAVSLNPKDSEANSNYGKFLCQLGEFDKAEPYFLRALENPLYRTPDLTYVNAGECAFRAGRVEQAETYFRRALEINPRHPVALRQMARISHRNGRFLSARAYLQRYLEVGRHTAQTLWLGIQIENELGDRDTSASYALLLKANFPDSEQTRMLIDSEK